MVSKVDNSFGKDNSIKIRGARQHNLKNIIIVEFFLFYAAERSRSLEAYSYTSHEPPPISSISSLFL